MNSRLPALIAFAGSACVLMALAAARYGSALCQYAL